MPPALNISSRPFYNAIYNTTVKYIRDLPTTPQKLVVWLLAFERLNAMHARFDGRMPWALTFSFSRAIQQPALEIWKGHDKNIAAAQQVLYRRSFCNNAARRGEYTAAMENDNHT